MAYKCREEIVGKRFLSVSGFTKLKLGKINEWGWRAGVIRAASHKDNKHPDLQVLVEYDDVEWQRREWISVFKDGLFHLFLVEGSLVWAERESSPPATPADPQDKAHCFWPALSFLALVDTSDMTAHSPRLPVEFLVDHELVFRDPSRLRPFKEWDPKLLGSPSLSKGCLTGNRKTLRRASPDDVRAAVRRWAEFQDGQRILLTTPSVLVGYRVEVYRAEGTTQWYTAVIVGYNESTRELTVTDDTVLEEHNEDPRLVQMRLIGDGVVESIMRGENAGITSRRSRSSAAAGSGLGGGSGGTHSSPAPSRVTRCYALSAAYGGGVGGGAGSGAGGGPGGLSSGGVSGANRNCTSSISRKPRSSRLAAAGEPPPLQHPPPDAPAPLAQPAAPSPPAAVAPSEAHAAATDVSPTSSAAAATEGEKDENVVLRATAPPPDCLQNPISKRAVTRDKSRLDRRRKGSGGAASAGADAERPPRGGRRGKAAGANPEEEEEEAAVRRRVKSESSWRRGAKGEKEEVEAEAGEVTKAKGEEGGGGEKAPPQEDSKEAKNEGGAVAEREAIVAKSLEGEDGGGEIGTTVRVKEEEKEESGAAEGGGESGGPAAADENLGSEERTAAIKEEAKTVPAKEERSSEGDREEEKRGGGAEDEVPSSPAPRMEGEPFIPHRHPLAHPGHQELSQQTPTSPAQSLLQHHASQPPSLRLSSDSLHAPPPASAPHPHPRGCCCCSSSDSGVSSASSSSSRCYSSGSGDERCSSGSRASSALSAEERSASAHEELSGVSQSTTSSRTATPPFPPSPVGAPSPSSRYLPLPADGKAVTSAAEAVRVWRDPTLATAQRVRHVHSVQHQTLMSHPPSSSPSAASSSSSVVFSAGGAVGAAPSAPGAAPLPASAPSVPPPASIAVTHAAAAAALSLGHHPGGAPAHHPHAHHYPPPLLGAHHHALHHGAALALAAAAAPPLYSQLPEMLWKPRYAPLPPGPSAHLLPPGHPAEDLLERERAYAQDRHERLLRERREQEARELEKQHKERERAERERSERERAERERAERERVERERRERAEQQERERMEKQRAAEQAVHKHFEESLRLAHQKQRNNMCWNLINSLPPPRTAATLVVEEAERKRAEHEQQQRLIAVRERERAYYASVAGTSAQQRPSSGPGKLEYPPPPAHSRMVEKSSEKNISGPGGHSPLPKVEPNFNLFGYPAYQPSGFLSPEKVKMESKSSTVTTASQLTMSSQPSSSSPGHPHHHSHSIGLGLTRELPNPPPLTSDLSKNSVIVKNEGKQQPSKVPQSHHQSQTPHMHGKSVGLQSSAYEYHQRSPTRSPIGLHHPSHHAVHHHHPSHHQHQSSSHQQNPLSHLTSEPQNLAKGPQLSHGQPSHNSQERASPYGAPTSNHLTYTPVGPPKANTTTSPYQAYGSSSMHQVSQPGPTSHYNPPGCGATSSLGNKPKVSSPAPPHIYGRPTAGVSSGGSTAGRTAPVDVPPATYPLPLTAKTLPYPAGVPLSHAAAASGSGPPPAHSGSDLRPYDPRAYPPTPITRPSTVQAVAVSHPSSTTRRMLNQSPSSVSSIPSVHRSDPPSHLHGPGAFQTQPLDLGLSDRSREEDSMSPKRKAAPERGNVLDSCVSKKRRAEMVSVSPVVSTMPQAVLARVSEPGPLVASVAASITTVVNTSLGAIPSDSSVGIPSISVASCRKNLGCVARSSSNLEESSASVSPRPPVSSSPAARQVPSSGCGASFTPVPPSSPILQSTRPPSVGGTESEKSNSPGPSRPAPQSTAPSYPVHKLKKAWLQRHSGEDGTEGMIVSRNGGGAFPCSPPSSQTGTASPSLGLSLASDTSSRRSQPSSPPRPRQQSKGKVGSEGQATGNKMAGGKRGGKDPVVTPNGHTVAMDASEILEDTSSSDPDCKSPTKRKVWKSKKRKKGVARSKVAEDATPSKRRGGGEGGDSQSESEKESGSDKESDSGGSTGQGRGGRGGSGGGGGNGTGSGGTAGRGAEGKEPRRRGRRPKARGEERARQSGGSGGGGSSSTQSQCATTANDCNTTRTASTGHLSNSSDSSRSVSSNARGGLRKGRSGGVDGGSGDPPRRDPCRKPPVSQLKKTGESFLQDGSCFEVAPKLAKCRECRWTPNQRSRNMPNIFCRFFAFRRLRYTKNGQLAMAGFSDPHGDASEEDLRLWLPQPDNPPSDLDVEMSRFLLSQVGDQFCDLVEQEKDAISLHMSEDKTIAWKRVVQGVREMCDVCETTLFNYHWACGKCGFVVCIDCYKGRKNGTIKIWEEAGKDRDDFSWLLCTNRQAHEQEKLMLTQIIADDSLLNLGAQVHSVRQKWGVPQYCRCISNKEQRGTNGIAKDLLKNLIKCETLNGVVKTEKNEGGEVSEGKKSSLRKNGANGGEIGRDDESKNSPLNWLADVALSNEDKKQSEGSLSSSDSEDDKENYSTLRELLIRPSNAGGGSSAPASPVQPSSSPQLQGATKSRSRSPTPTGGPTCKKSRVSAVDTMDTMDTLDQVISSAIRDVAGERVSERCLKGEEGGGGTEEAAAPLQLKHFIRRFSLQSREPLPIRIMTLAESMALYPDVPHSWLCDGKLLRLHEPNNCSNYRIFQDQWKRGQPVLVSDVTKSLDLSLWHPDSFARDFGDDKNDLINCSTGNIVPNQPMRRFWEGFEVVSRRLRDDKGQPMLLKLKDWPPGEDFAETLPARFADLMKALPLTEYTHRNGRLNIASRLPECFVRPDLGPKMYNAYGSAMHPSKGTTNLHLDVSDAVNVMVYVGIPQDAGETDEHTKEALRAIEEAGCDILTRRRVKEKGIIPGALWHIYAARDADRIRDLLNKVAIEQGARLEPHHDPIHDQSWYLDGALRDRLYAEYGVEGFALVQCLGDAVFIPAGAPHQVRNLHSCIKVAEDFVSPENVSHCFHLTQEFRELSDTHTNHEDKLQIKNIIYHAVKDSLSVLMGQSKVEEDKKAGEGEEGPSENPSNTTGSLLGDGELMACPVTVKEEPAET